jgi:hypothetical protein
VTGVQTCALPIYFQAATKKYVDDNSGGGSPDWGDIGGTLSDQTDLQSALDAKLSLTGGTVTGAVTLQDDLIHTGTEIGVFGATPTTQSIDWLAENGTGLKEFDVSTATLGDLADVVASIVNQNIALGFYAEKATSAANITSIQKVSITMNAVSSNTATITAVNTSRTAVFINGINSNQVAVGIDRSTSTVELTNSTTVTVSRRVSTGIVTINATIVEFGAGLVASVQRGSISLTGTNTSGTSAITAVDLSRSIVIDSGWTTNNTTNNQMGSESAILDLQNATTVRATTSGTYSTNRTYHWNVIEFVSGVTTINTYTGSFGTSDTV